MASQTIPYITPEEYLKAERKAEFKSEYRDGQVLARPRVAPRHCGIATNLTARLGAAVEGGPCRVFGSGLRVHVPASSLFAYPDASVVCGEPVFFQNDSLENPIVIVEVGTTKFFDYQSIPSLKEYLMIAQQSHSVTHCTRLRGEWRIEILGEERGSILLPSIGVELQFAQIYAGADSLPG